MINYLKNLFFHENKENQVSETLDNAIGVVLKEKYAIPLLQLNIKHTTDDAAINFAKVLIALNKGLYYKDMLELLSELSTRNKEYEIFCNKVFLSLQVQLNTLSQEINSNDDPIVKPSTFSKS